MFKEPEHTRLQRFKKGSKDKFGAFSGKVGEYQLHIASWVKKKREFQRGKFTAQLSNTLSGRVSGDKRYLQTEAFTWDAVLVIGCSGAAGDETNKFEMKLQIVPFFNVGMLRD